MTKRTPAPPISPRSARSGPRTTSSIRRRSSARTKTPIRNHGLFSKAERALQIADWSEKAREDVEIFTLVEAEGLTPLLMVLNERPDLHYPEGRAARRRSKVTRIPPRSCASLIVEPQPRPLPLEGDQLAGARQRHVGRAQVGPPKQMLVV